MHAILVRSDPSMLLVRLFALQARQSILGRRCAASFGSWLAVLQAVKVSSWREKRAEAKRKKEQRDSLAGMKTALVGRAQGSSRGKPRLPNMTTGVKVRKLDLLIEKFINAKFDKDEIPDKNVASPPKSTINHRKRRKCKTPVRRSEENSDAEDEPKPSTSGLAFTEFKPCVYDKKTKKSSILDPTNLPTGDTSLTSATNSSDYAAAYATAASFGAFLPPPPPSVPNRGNMDTYPMTAHTQITPANVSVSESSPTNINSNNYVQTSYDGYTYYQQYQPIHSPSFINSYNVQTEQNSPISNDGDDGTSSLVHAARASPETLLWLEQNYEPCEGSSLPRCTIYKHYQRHCTEKDIEPVNAASFGKLIRSVFRGLKTRRLGTRGNSKYHYYGIRIKPNSIYLCDAEEGHNRSSRAARRPESCYSTRSSVAPTTVVTAPASGDGRLNSESRDTNEYLPEHCATGNTVRVNGNGVPNEPISANGISDDIDEYSNLMGHLTLPTVTVPDFSHLELYLTEVELEISHVTKFMEDYVATWNGMLHLVKQMRLKDTCSHWYAFWNPSTDTVAPALTHTQMLNIVKFPEIARTIEKLDIVYYQALLDLFMPNILLPIANEKYTNKVRGYAKIEPSNVKKALTDDEAPMEFHYPAEFVNMKVSTAECWSRRLKRYTSIHHLSDAARSVMTKTKEIDQMYKDFSKIDIPSLEEQAGWATECDPLLFSRIFNSFKDHLKNTRSIDDWAEWMEAVVDQCLAKYHDQPAIVQLKKSKKLVVQWNYFASAIIRDLTLRSAESFGSFHLLRMLFDDYIFYLIECRLAKAAITPVLTVLSKSWPGNDTLSPVMEPMMLVQHSDSDNVIVSSDAHNQGIQYVLPKYVFANNNDVIITSNANGTSSYVMMADANHTAYSMAQPLETIVYVDHKGTPQPAPTNAEHTQYIVMSAAPQQEVVEETHESHDHEENEVSQPSSYADEDDDDGMDEPSEKRRRHEAEMDDWDILENDTIENVTAK
uniref:RFX-type winged-helix domain-containing protein n=1 Tax=Panagrellus redivivus TaxID=6233 RepID=A0A7E4VC43_PANRE